MLWLQAITVADPPLRAPTPEFAPATPAPPVLRRDGAEWRIASAVPATLWVDGRAQAGAAARRWTLRAGSARRCLALTVREGGVDSLPSDPVCVGDSAHVAGAWPRAWTAPAAGDYVLRLAFENPHGPINTGITAAVKRITVRCGAAPPRTLPVVMPQGRGWQRSTTARFHAAAGARCSFALRQGFNMSFLAQAALYTGGEGGSTGPLNQARVGDLLISPAPAGVVRATPQAAPARAGGAP